MTHEQVSDCINHLISEYDFPSVVLQDVDKRLSDSGCLHYAAQQLRFLDNIVCAGIAKKREVESNG